MVSLRGKIVVLTGASSGIGRATALALADEGAVLHLVARRGEALEDVCESIRATGGQASAHAFDVREPLEFKRLADELEHIDVLINNAGAGVTKRFMETTDEDWRWTFDTNLYSVVSAIRSFLPTMLEQGHGTIVNISSIVAVTGSALPAYTAAKSAILGLSESLAVEYGPRGVEMVVVIPGPTNTGIAAAAVQEGRSERELNTMMQETLERHGAPPEVIARDIVRAVKRPRFLVYTPTSAAFMRTVHRLLPRLSRTLTRKMSYPS